MYLNINFLSPDPSVFVKLISVNINNALLKIPLQYNYTDMKTKIFRLWAYDQPTKFNKLTPWNIILPEKLIVAWLVKKFLVLYGTRSFITVFTGVGHIPPLKPILGLMNPVHIFTLFL
jgi:hypothetical protein